MDLLVSTLGGMDCILGMEFITQNNVLIEGHNRLVRIPSKSGIVRVKAHELPCVGGSTIHFMLGKTWEKVSQLHFGAKCENATTLPKVRKWSPPGFPKTQKTI